MPELIRDSARRDLTRAKSPDASTERALSGVKRQSTSHDYESQSEFESETSLRIGWRIRKFMGITRDQGEDSDSENSPTADGTALEDEQVSVKNKEPSLSKSNRLKGYMFLFLFSIINFNAAIESNRGSFDQSKAAVPPSPVQQGYAASVAMLTIVLTGIIIIFHFDRITCLRKYWYRAFKRNSKIELFILIFLVIWWSIATWINTTVTGIAGEGKSQYNLYFSTWGCCITTFWTVERWRTAAGQISTQKFLHEMPARSSLWAITFISNILSFSFVLQLANEVETVAPDVPLLYSLYVVDPPHAFQWALVTIVAGCSWILAIIFVAFELFRKEVKGDCENLAEGIILLILSILWIPTVTIVTVPGGVAQIVGNTYFWTWAATASVMKTFAKWILDWREAIHEQIEVQLLEYEMAKNAVIEQTKGADDAKDAEDTAKDHVHANLGKLGRSSLVRPLSAEDDEEREDDKQDEKVNV